MALNRYMPMRQSSLKPKRGRVPDPGYLRWLRNQPCAVPGCTASFIESAHIGPRGFGVRCDDRQAIPLCAGHHRTRRDAHHVLGKQFWEHHGLDRWLLIEYYNSMYF